MDTQTVQITIPAFTGFTFVGYQVPKVGQFKQTYENCLDEVMAHLGLKCLVYERAKPLVRFCNLYTCGAVGTMYSDPADIPTPLESMGPAKQIRLVQDMEFDSNG